MSNNVPNEPSPADDNPFQPHRPHGTNPDAGLNCAAVYVRRRHEFRALRQQTILLLDDGMVHYFRERGHRADLNTIRRGANSAQFFDSAQIDYSLGLLDSILQPVEAVEPSGQHPDIRSVLFEKFLCIGNGTWLIQLECGHYVSYDSHNSP